jgi:UDP:flavonoid glycosyltransferase YjiC (YdhE family)
MANILCVTWDGGGNVPPALGIAAELLRRHHTVRFLGHARQRTAIETAGCEFLPFTHARHWSSVEPHPGSRGVMQQLAVFTDRGIGEDLLAAARQHQPDVVVIDCLLFGALQAADRAGLKRVVLFHLPYTQQRATWERGMPAMLARLRGLRPPDLWSRSDLVVVTTLPEIDPCGGASGTLRQTGPVWQGGRPEPASPGAGDPFVLASLSTIYQDGQVKALQSIVDGLATLPVRALVTTGPSVDPAALRPANNVEIRRFVPHADVMPRASLMISHGGHSTTMAALGHDLPLVVMPMFAQGDQPAIGRALADLGAARVVNKTASAGQIAGAVRDLLADERSKVAARALGATIRRHDGAVQAADAVEGIIALTPA